MQNLRRRGPGYYPTHDTRTNPRKRSTIPIASSALADSDAARFRRARAERRFNLPDESAPCPGECHTDHAARSAPKDDRHPSGNKRCPARQPNHPLRPARLTPSDPPPPVFNWWRQTAHRRWQRRELASTCAKHWGRWIARSCARDGGGARNQHCPDSKQKRAHLSERVSNSKSSPRPQRDREPAPKAPAASPARLPSRTRPHPAWPPKPAPPQSPPAPSRSSP